MSEPVVGEIVVALAEALTGGDILFAAADEPAALAVVQALGAASPDALVLFCPGSDALPGERAPASPANVGQRVSALRRMRIELVLEGRAPIACVTTGEALGRLYPPPDAFAAEPPRVDVGAAVSLATLFEQLEAIGYIADDRVDEPGEVALRGQVLDVFPADTIEPLRIEAIDGHIASIRSYDPADQRTTGECDGRELGRVSEPALDEHAVVLLDHLPDARVALAPGADDRRRRFLALAADAARGRSKRALRDVAGEKSWAAALTAREPISIESAGDLPPRFVEGRVPLKSFTRIAATAFEAGDRVVLLGSARDLRFLIKRAGKALGREVQTVRSWADVVAAEPSMLLALPVVVDRGFRRDGIVAVAAADLIGSRAERHDSGAGHADASLFDFSEIHIGDVIVHEDHGIGVVAGLDRMSSGDAGEPGDAVKLTYADNGVRLVPVAEADRIWRYGGEADAVALDRLDGSSWEKRRREIDAVIAETARGLTQLAEERATRTAPILEPDAAAYERFAAGFAFTETSDQARAIAAVRADLASGKRMDRLVVADVGYGKTEVALRAAAIAALAGHQVAIAAPTTVLARQHVETFTARFEGTGIVVAGLSRLSTAAEKARVRKGLADGSVHIVIGTGAVAAKGVAYQNLALVIVDEEQRFGAADKDRLRSLSAGHVLTLSATPIPRTLQTALVGLQQLSLIATPPARRQPIRTSVGPFVDATVRTALLREKSRGGQSFVVVPRVEDMASLAGILARLVPELEILQAHGKMPAAAIDEAMVRFGGGDGDVLLATNIIEAGLDVPRANTMVIWRADRFGLAQLHQLRGRVGRGSRRGQVILLTDPAHEIAPRTLKRLRTLEVFDRLGAGFAISARDLDVRGAGDLLGETQAGHMKLIGIDLYQELLQGALRTARGEQVDRWSPELRLGIEGRLPERWIPDEELRVTLYMRLARLTDSDALAAFEAELEDRFGVIPDEAQTLLTIARIRADARSAGIARIVAGPAAIAFTPRSGAGSAVAAPGLVSKDGRWLLQERIDDPIERLRRIEQILLQHAQADAD
ncbi:DEAD/DEAH box helicase [Sphingomonas sp. MMS24-J13]|uniref:DEAD/DEAH box helicase n=1 Tax=Sphingomonas sp. MMS24-J13 TaxID=3238686 RepID=UPI00384CA729